MIPAKLRLAMVCMGKPGTKVSDLCTELGITRQTLYRHVSPTGELRPDGEKPISGTSLSRSAQEGPHALQQTPRMPDESRLEPI